MSILNRSLLLYGPYTGPTGYDIVVRNLALQFIQRDIIFRLENYSQWCNTKIPIDPIFDTLKEVQISPKILLACCLPEQVPRNEGMINTALTMFEVDRIPPIWVEATKQIDAVIVPNAFNKDVWVRSGVPSYKIHSIHLGIDHPRFNLNTPRIPLYINGRDITTVHPKRVIVVQEVIPRKNIEAVIEAWIRAFPGENEDKCLLIKASSYSTSNVGKIYTLSRKLRNKYGIKRHAPIYVYTSLLTDDELPGFLANGTHYFSMSRGEAVDLSALQCIALGITPIVPRHTAYKEYLNDEVAYYVDSKSVPVQNLSFPLRRLYCYAKWEEPSIEHAVEQLRTAVKAPKDRNQLNAFSQAYQWKSTAKKVINILEELVCPKTVPTVSNKSLAPIVFCPSLNENCGIAEYTRGFGAALNKVMSCGVIGGPSTYYLDFIAHPVANVVHIQHEYQFFTPTRLQFLIRQAHRAGKKVVITQHTLANVPEHNEVIKSADGIIVHSEYSRDYALSKLGYPALSTFVCPMGIGPPLSAPGATKDDGMFVLAFFGFCYYHKGVHKLISAFKHLKKKYPKLLLYLLSSKPKQDNYYYAQCKILAKDVEGIQWHDQYLPEEKVVMLLSLADLIVLPYEDYGGVGTSAAVRTCLRAQRPLLVSDTCWFSDLDEFIAPRIEKRGNLISAIESYLQGYNFDPWIEAIKSYVQKHQWDNVIDQYINVYRTVLL